MSFTALIALLPIESPAAGLFNDSTFVWSMLAIVAIGALLWSWAWSRRRQPSEPHKRPRFPRSHI